MPQTAIRKGAKGTSSIYLVSRTSFSATSQFYVTREYGTSCDYAAKTIREMLQDLSEQSDIETAKIYTHDSTTQTLTETIFYSKHVPSLLDEINTWCPSSK